MGKKHSGKKRLLCLTDEPTLVLKVQINAKKATAGVTRWHHEEGK